MSPMPAREGGYSPPRHYGSTAATNQPGAIATYMESLLRDLRDARDACNKLPFDDALRDKIATELDRIIDGRRIRPSRRVVRLRSPPCCASSTASPLGGQAKVLRARVALS